MRKKKLEDYLKIGQTLILRWTSMSGLIQRILGLRRHVRPGLRPSLFSSFDFGICSFNYFLHCKFQFHLIKYVFNSILNFYQIP